MLALEIFDVFGGNPGVMSTFGFYRESDPTTLIPIFGPLDQAGVPQQATIDFNLGFVVDDDEAALESVFTPGMGAIGFYMELVFGGGTALLYTESALNTDFGGVDVFATWQNDIDPNLCNAIHNINACTPEELEELGMAPVTGSLAVGEYYPVPNVEPKPEPLFPDGEAQYEVQSHEEADAQDCGLAGGTVYVTADGEMGCNIPHELEDGGVGETPAQPPTVIPEPEVLPSAG